MIRVLRALALRAVFFAAVALAIELLARGGLALLERRGIRYEPILADRLSDGSRRAIEDFLAGRDSAFQLDEVLGWTLRPGYHSPEVTVDAAGRRRDPNRPAPASGAIRLAAFGDSFTFGGDVADRDVFLEVLARRESRFEVANYGVPAYGLDQTYLRYLSVRQAARPQVVLIGYLSENICRDVNVFRPFYNPGTVFPLAKPRYLPRTDEGLELLANPLPSPASYRRLLAKPAEVLAELGRHDRYFAARPHAGAEDRSAAVRVLKLTAAQLAPAERDGCYGDEEAFLVTSRLFKLFHQTLLADGATPLILVFPSRDEVAAWRSQGRKRYAPLLRFFEEQRYPYLDLMEVFDGPGRARPVEELLPSHLSPRGNELVAESLLELLRKGTP